MPRPADQSDPVRILGEARVVTSGKMEFRDQEMPSERTSRLRRAEANDAHRRRMETIVLGGTLLGVAAVCGLCIWLALRPGFSAEDKKWATSIHFAVVSAAVGRLSGKS